MPQIEGGDRVQRMSREDIERTAQRLRLAVSAYEIEGYLALAEFMAQTLDRFERLEGPKIKQFGGARRHSGIEATASNDPLNAIRRWVFAERADARGLLSGVRVAVKDNIPVAGIPMTYGSSVLDGFVAEEDAVLTGRILDAGGRIVAVTNMEGFAFSGGGETCAHGQVMNPFDLARTASGSSSGAAAGLWYDEFELAWGTDTGGSCRIPASWCGVLGLKPTHGLVPFTGIPTTDWRFDHAGPLARTVEMLARGLEAVVDAEPVDDATPSDPVRVKRPSYVETVREDIGDLGGVSIGIVEDGFADDLNAPAGTSETTKAVREACRRFKDLGARTISVRLPVLATSVDIMFAGLLESVTATTFGWPSAYHWFSHSSAHFAEALHAGIEAHGDELPENFKAVLLLGAFLNERYGGTFSARAHAFVPELRAAVDTALIDCDILVMPTTTHTPHEWQSDDFVKRSLRGWTMLANVPLFNLTGHPALSMPAASAGGLPVGVMAVARRHHDATLLRAAAVYERSIGWEPRVPLPEVVRRERAPRVEPPGN